MDIYKTIVTLFITGIVIYVGFQFLKEMLVTLWTISPLTCIGFVASIIMAIWNGRIRIERGAQNLQILGLIFAGTAISHFATSQLQTAWNNFIAGNLVGAGIMGIVILIIYLKGQEIQNTNP